LAWLSDLSFYFESKEIAWSEFSDIVTIMEGESGALSWNDLTNAQKIDILTFGNCLIDGKPFVLEKAKVYQKIKTEDTLSRTDITYNDIGQMISYSDTGSNSGVGYYKNWYAGFDDSYNEIGQLIHYKEEGKQEGSAAYSTERSQITYNVKNQITGYTDKAWSASSPGLIKTTVVDGLTYDALNRQLTLHKVVHEYGQIEETTDGAAVITEVDKITSTFMDGMRYDSFNRMKAYREVSFEKSRSLRVLFYATRF